MDEFRVISLNINVDLELEINSWTERGWHFVSLSINETIAVIVFKRKRVIH